MRVGSSKKKLTKHLNRGSNAYTAYEHRYTTTPVACEWAGAIVEVSGAFGMEQYDQTRLDTRLPKSRAGGQGLCGWAGAVFEVTRLFGQER